MLRKKLYEQKIQVMIETDKYTIKETLNHNDILEFIKPWLKKKNIYTITYNLSVMAGFLVVGAFVGIMLARGEFNFEIMNQFLLGVMIGFLMIPIHELLHGIAYKIVGAETVQYRAVWKKLLFYVVADGFPAGYKEFRFIALLPFTVITLIGILLIFLSGFEWTVIMLGFIITHAACCGGDFGLLSYMYEHKDEEMITIDDMEKGETYFLVKKKEAIN